MGYMQAVVEIRSVPHGEAPLWVREKWVGLKLPTVLLDDTLVSARTFGVLSAPRGRLRELWAIFRGRFKRASGFPVPVIPALKTLETVSPEAAAWWVQHAPHLIKPHACFMFEASCGRIGESAR